MSKSDARRVDEAHARILKWIRVTPIIRMQGPGARPMVLKLECLQRSGSFKLRGALNKLMTLGESASRGVVTASGGNHGLGVAWAGWLTGTPVTVFLPENAPSMKIERIERANARVTRVEGNYADAESAALSWASAEGLPYIHAYDDAEVICGQGTLVREFMSQAPEVQTIVTSIGGGGLASGAILAREHRRVVGVEPYGAATMHAALESGKPVTIDKLDSIAKDSLGAARAGKLTFKVCRKGLDRVELVSDRALMAAQRWLWEHLRIICELGAAAGLAALEEGLLDDDPGPLGIIICGANVNPRKFIQ